MMFAPRINSRAMRNAARGEHCTLEIVGACWGGTDTTVLAHLPDESHGISRKPDDLSACFACVTCHDVIDGRRPWPSGEKGSRDGYMRRAQTRTWRRLFEKGVLNIKGVTI